MKTKCLAADFPLSFTFAAAVIFAAASARADIHWLRVDGDFYDAAKWQPEGGVQFVPGAEHVPFFQVNPAEESYTVTFAGAPAGELLTTSWLNIGWSHHPLTLDLSGREWLIKNHFYSKNLEAGAYTIIRNGKMRINGTFSFENSNNIDSGIILENAEIVASSSTLQAGTIVIGEGAALSVTNSILYVGNGAGNTVKLVMTGGVLDAKNIYLGDNGGFGHMIVSNGMFNPSGGNIFVGRTDASTTNGTLEIRGGAGRGEIRVGDAWLGHAEISGGEHVFRNFLIGNADKGDGVLEISGGDIVATNLTFSAGRSTAKGAVVMTGGNVDVKQYTDLNAGIGHLTLRGGSYITRQLRTAVSGATAATSYFGLSVEGGRFEVTNAVTFGTACGMTNRWSISGGEFISRANIDPGSSNYLGIDFTGGVFTFPSLYALKLISSNLVNRGGTLAPGGIGAAGRTEIHGDYIVASPAAALDLDIGGTAQTSGYDLLQMGSSGRLTLGGKLNLRVINGFNPAPANNFEIIRYTAGGLLSQGGPAAFSNVANGKVFTEDGLWRFDIFDVPANNTFRLNNAAPNERVGANGAWEDGGFWTLLAPGIGNDYTALFGMKGSGAIALNSALAIQGVIFTNPAPYSISGTGSLDTARIENRLGSHSINVPLAQTQDLAVFIAEDSIQTLGAISGGKALIKTGAGTLRFNDDATLDSLAIEAGALSLRSLATLNGGLSIASNDATLSLDTDMSEIRIPSEPDAKAFLETLIRTERLRIKGRVFGENGFLIRDHGDGWTSCASRVQPSIILVR
jgi:hypothetical protein